MFQPDFEILYEEEACLAVNKPAGLLTQAPRGIDSLELRVKTYLMEKEKRNYLGVPHRLDRPVSGVILFGKHSRATRRLSEQFEKRHINKTYWAVAEGMVKPRIGTWIDFVRKVPDKPLAEIVAPINPDAREAILHYTVFNHFELEGKTVTLLEIKLETGRMHQIRLQCSVHGHPILGDATYGSSIPFGDYFNEERCREIALHARSIMFLDPITRKHVNLTAPFPILWNKTLQNISADFSF
ncbi:MAG: RluA family pseudouridine synthase [Planctomycetaceae bacterium]|jgi:RluA family pseudouridine synthase|nr:RluA family pseudouridine synthase [Planctomycetaceae bacterium]